MTFDSSNIQIAAGLFLGMLAFLWLGRRIAVRKMSSDPNGCLKGTGAVEAVIFGLLVLLVAFTFWGASNRLETGRQLVAEEANSIVTAYLRVKLLPQEAQQRLRENFRRYVDIRLELRRNFSNLPTSGKDRAMMVSVQSEIWNEAVSACKNLDSQATTMLLLPAINRMIDTSSAGSTDAGMRPIETTFLMLCVLAIISSMVAGYRTAGQKQPDWTLAIAYCSIVALSVYVILDLEHARFGLTQTDQINQTLLELKQTLR